MRARNFTKGAQEYGFVCFLYVCLFVFVCLFVLFFFCLFVCLFVFKALRPGQHFSVIFGRLPGLNQY